MRPFYWSQKFSTDKISGAIQSFQLQQAEVLSLLIVKYIFFTTSLCYWLHFQEVWKKTLITLSYNNAWYGRN